MSRMLVHPPSIVLGVSSTGSVFYLSEGSASFTLPSCICNAYWTKGGTGPLRALLQVSGSTQHTRPQYTDPAWSVCREVPLQESSELLANLGETTIPADLPAAEQHAAAAAEGSPAPTGDHEDVTRKEDDNHAGGIVSAFWESLGELRPVHHCLGSVPSF